MDHSSTRRRDQQFGNDQAPRTPSAGADGLNNAASSAPSTQPAQPTPKSLSTTHLGDASRVSQRDAAMEQTAGAEASRERISRQAVAQVAAAFLVAQHAATHATKSADQERPRIQIGVTYGENAAVDDINKAMRENLAKATSVTIVMRDADGVPQRDADGNTVSKTFKPADLSADALAKIIDAGHQVTMTVRQQPRDAIASALAQGATVQVDGRTQRLDGFMAAVSQLQDRSNTPEAFEGRQTAAAQLKPIADHISASPLPKTPGDMAFIDAAKLGFGVSHPDTGQPLDQQWLEQPETVKLMSAVSGVSAERMRDPAVKAWLTGHGELDAQASGDGTAQITFEKDRAGVLAHPADPLASGPTLDLPGISAPPPQPSQPAAPRLQVDADDERVLEGAVRGASAAPNEQDKAPSSTWAADDLPEAPLAPGVNILKAGETAARTAASAERRRVTAHVQTQDAHQGLTENASRLESLSGGRITSAAAMSLLQDPNVIATSEQLLESAKNPFNERENPTLVIPVNTVVDTDGRAKSWDHDTVREQAAVVLAADALSLDRTKPYTIQEVKPNPADGAHSMYVLVKDHEALAKQTADIRAAITEISNTSDDNPTSVKGLSARIAAASVYETHVQNGANYRRIVDAAQPQGGTGIKAYNIQGNTRDANGLQEPSYDTIVLAQHMVSNNEMFHDQIISENGRMDVMTRPRPLGSDETPD